jgi:hypothetical protein
MDHQVYLEVMDMAVVAAAVVPQEQRSLEQMAVAAVVLTTKEPEQPATRTLVPVAAEQVTRHRGLTAVRAFALFGIGLRSKNGTLCKN